MSANELNYYDIGKRIRDARDKIGLRQADLAAMTELTTAHISHIETGNTRLALPTIVKIANALSVSVDELLCENLEEVKPITFQDTFTLSEITKMLGLHRNTVYSIIDSNSIPTITDGRIKRVKKADFETWYNSQNHYKIIGGETCGINHKTKE